MAKAKDNNTVRQRKKTDNSAGDAEPKSVTKAKTTGTPVTKSAPAKPVASGKGMSCMNWFLVIFLISAATGVASILLFQEITKEVATMRILISDAKASDDQFKMINERFESIKKLEGEITKMTKQENQRKADIDRISAALNKLQESTEYEVTNVKKWITTLRKEKESKESADVSKLEDQLKVASADVAQLTKEIARLDESQTNKFDQVQSMQQEIIDLTADKVAASSAIESIKSTIVSVRDSVEKMSPGGAIDKDAQNAMMKKIDDLDKKLAAEVESLSRQITETSENSAKWLGTSTSDIESRFQKNIEQLKKEMTDIKNQQSSPVQATPDQSVLNSVAVFEEKVKGLEKLIAQLGEVMALVQKAQKESEASVTKQFEGSSKTLTELTQVVDDVSNRDDAIKKTVETLEENFFSLRSDLNSVQTIARILVSRVDEIRSGVEEKAAEPASAPDQPEGAIPDPDVQN